MTDKKQFPCIESFVELELDPYLIRVWRDEKSVEDTAERENDDIVAELNALIELEEEAEENDEEYQITPQVIAKAIAGLKDINAVHVLDTETNEGLIIYVNWP